MREVCSALIMRGLDNALEMKKAPIGGAERQIELTAIIPQAEEKSRRCARFPVLFFLSILRMSRDLWVGGKTNAIFATDL